MLCFDKLVAAFLSSHSNFIIRDFSSIESYHLLTQRGPKRFRLNSVAANTELNVSIFWVFVKFKLGDRYHPLTDGCQYIKQKFKALIFFEKHKGHPFHFLGNFSASFHPFGARFGLFEMGAQKVSGQRLQSPILSSVVFHENKMDVL